ncbi:LytR/AlgR family response regulator transcription factor [Rhizomicrobium electricum]|jgi:two-component system LytT family response regulator|uniref:LytTR family DNA-binding domain-containing protein n=1 Tax=Rhizomicrobium electricum TaxID=480070 RepID=A0ABP3PT58_9PROT|nr:response regulator [Rhizomicrobium electricum]NIJ49057.1 two-component system LytT family response regulator [Rhizomicrobium electricum]
MAAREQALRVLVVDDEALARSRLTNLLKRDPQVGEIFEAQNGLAAIDLIEAEHPDVVFLDVQMPQLDGFGVIEALGAENMPQTIFVTAYDRYAVRAFEADAADYLVKPFADERFEQSMTRVKSRLATAQPMQLGPNIRDVAGGGALWTRLVVRVGGVVRLISIEEIDWIEAANVYVNLHVGPQEFLYRIALSHLATKLDPLRFVRIHRSAIVNIERIKELEPIGQGEFEVVLANGNRLHLSKTYRMELEKRLGQSL